MFVPPTSSIAHAAPPKLPDVSGAGKLDLHVEKLDNGVRIITNNRPGATSMKVAIGIGAGALQDPQGREGMAHLIEHMTFEGNKKAPTSEALWKKLTAQGNFANAYTSHHEVVWHATATNADARKAAELYTNMFLAPKTSGPSLTKQKEIVQREMQFSSARSRAWREANQLLIGDQPLSRNDVLGTVKTIDKVQPQDIQDYVKQYFVGRNTVAFFDGDAKKMPLDVFRKELGKLAPGARADNHEQFHGFRKGAAVKVIPNPSDSTVEIDMMFPVPNDAAGKLKPGAASMVTKMLSDKAFDLLREKHHITYGAMADPSGLSSDIDGFQVIDVSARVPASRVRQAVADIASVVKSMTKVTASDLNATKQMVTKRIEATPVSSVSDRAWETFIGAVEDGGLPKAGVGPDPAASSKARIAAMKKITTADAREAAQTLFDFSQVKIMAQGPKSTLAQIRLGMKDAGIKGVLANVPYDASYYKEQTSRK